MKGKILKIFFIIENLVLAFALILCLLLADSNKTTELFREYSPDREYILYITEIGTPAWPFGADRVRITLYKSEFPDQSVSFLADVRNDGARAEYEVTWLDNGVQIALSGEEQLTSYYILPFKTLSESSIS